MRLQDHEPGHNDPNLVVILAVTELPAALSYRCHGATHPGCQLAGRQFPGEDWVVLPFLVLLPMPGRVLPLRGIATPTTSVSPSGWWGFGMGVSLC